MNKIALLDADVICYRVGFAAEHKTYLLKFHNGPSVNMSQSDPLGTRELSFDGKTAMNKWLKEHPQVDDYTWESSLQVEPLEYVLSTLKHMIEHICKGAGTDKYILCLSGKNNFRNEVATVLKYKGNRDQMRRPMWYEDIIEYIKKNHPYVQEDTLEADDIIADLSAALKTIGDDPIICTVDKDMQQIPGKYYSFVKGERMMITEATARKNLLKQMLTGDSSDNVPGIPGIGPVKATRALYELEDWAAVEEVEAMWHNYLGSTSPPEWLEYYDEGELKYKRWDGHMEQMSLSEFLSQQHRLLSLGVRFKNGPPTKQEATEYINTAIPQALLVRYGISI